MSVVTQKPPAAASRTAATPVRTDIQAMRAVAVAAVVIYHVWPTSLSGGYVGVDVFFVISGFLITSHLLRHPPRGGRDLAQFWSRRIRRLLPASLLVLLATLAATYLVAPETQWANTARQSGAAALYVVNWLLAGDAVDYLAAESAATPVQHFWSLSVEEQFYLGWPILVLALVWLARRRNLPVMRAVGVGLGLVVAASFAFSVTETVTDPARAYFVTPTRVWELGIGALLAVAVAATAPRRWFAGVGPVARDLLAVLGLAAVALAVVTYSSATPFPGWQAAVPVLGAALVIAAVPSAETGPVGRIMALRPVQWLGDVSYSVYLWHWPLIVLVPYASGGSAGWLDKVVIVLATLLLAGVTKTQVEDRFRTGSWGRPLVKPYALAAVGMAAVLVASWALSTALERQQEEAQRALAEAVRGDDPCFGAAALDTPETCPPVDGDDVVPAPAEAATDKSAAYEDVGGQDCWSYLPRFRTVTCTFGDPDGQVSVALVGNSHAGQWLPALEAVAEQRGWRITTYLASRCAMAATPQAFDSSSGTDACADWVDRTAQDIVDDQPDLVLMTNRISAQSVDGDTAEDFRAGYRDVLARWDAAELDVVALADTPFPAPTTGAVPECVALHTDDLDACSGERADWLPPDPVEQAAADVGGRNVTYADLNDHVCGPRRCESVVGGVIVYFDGSHLTATYARTIAPYLGPVLDGSLGGR
ncbi:peptidoglycan/LPS O-acetylase OafA/YrhL [Mumia flava]|uniref:Peptidoglycan/LPS O-acetylase OafA/YrhL n=1 Tax=Mumia flava TaxID=1348852 RepID=A0A2M9BJP7_9ACTN|nr:acyltransferase family protein [Mumia flava]PJJ58142.1 peptidoglycan/LPS O-acetylase OafA/YrhL [Mumia flava]